MKNSLSWLLTAFLLVGMVAGGCSTSTPEKNIPSPLMFLQMIGKDRIHSNGQVSQALTLKADCLEGTGSGEMAGTLVDPNSGVGMDHLGTGAFAFDFCGEAFTATGQSFGALVTDPSYGDWYVAVIGDFNSQAGPFVAIQFTTQAAINHPQGEIPVDNVAAAVFLLDGTFENILAYSLGGTIRVETLGAAIGDPMVLKFEGSFAPYGDDPQPETNAYASFEVTASDMSYCAQDSYCMPTLGTGRFAVTLDGASYQGGPDAYAYLNQVTCDDYPCGGELDIAIGDFTGFGGNFLYIQVFSNPDQIPDGDPATYQAWATLYDASYNVLAYSDVTGLVSSWDSFPTLDALFTGEFFGHMIGQDQPPVCTAKAGSGKGNFDTWLNHGSGWAAYIGTGHVQVALDSGELLDIGEQSRAVVVRR